MIFVSIVEDDQVIRESLKDLIIKERTDWYTQCVRVKKQNSHANKEPPQKKEI